MSDIMQEAGDGQQELPLPPEVAALGPPLQIHYASWSLSKPLMTLLAGLFFLVSAGGFVVMYWKVPMKEDDPVPPETMLYIAGGVGVVGLLMSLAGWWTGGLVKRGRAVAYLIYPHALVLFQEET